MPVAALLGAWLWGRATGFNWLPWVPSWILVLQACDETDKGSSPATDELMIRLGKGSLSDAQAAFLVNRALDAQADPHGAWFGRWDAAFESAWNNGQVTDKQVERYGRGFVFGWSLDHLAEIRVGEPYIISEYVQDFRGMPNTPTVLHRSIKSMTMEGHAVRRYAGLSEADFVRIGTPIKGKEAADYHWLAHECPPVDVPAGDWEIEVKWSMWIQTPGGATARNIHFDGEMARGIRFVDRDESVVSLVVDPQLKEAMRNAITLRPLRPLQVLFESESGYPRGAADIRNLRENVGFNVFFVIDGREYLAGSLPVEKASRRRVESFGGREYRIPDFDASQITVVLRPDPAVVEHKMTIFPSRIWGGEIVFENVPITKVDRRPKPAIDPPDQ